MTPTTAERDGRTPADTVYRPLAVRAYPEILEHLRPGSTRPFTPAASPPATAGPWIERWPRTGLIFDCETRIDASQRLTVGFAVVLRSDWRRDRQKVVGVVCFADEAALSRPERLTLEAWLGDSLPEVLARVGFAAKRLRLPRRLEVEYQPIAAFRETFYALAYRGRAAVAAFNLGWGVSRLAVRATPTKNKRGFTFTLIDTTDCRGRKGTKLRHPRIRVVPIDGRRALVQFTGTKPRYDGRFVDLKPLGDALTGQLHTLGSACEAFGAGTKAAHEHDGRVTRELLDYALNDALVTAELYLVQVEEHRRHPIAKAPNAVYSEASIGKAYLIELGLRLPELVVDPPVGLSVEEVLGLATTTYVGGRVECRVRKHIVPVTYCDYASLYPSVFTLSGLWSLLTADRVRVVDATEEVRRMLEEATPDDLFDPATWQDLSAIVEVRPDGDVLPARARYGDETYAAYGVGVNPLTSRRPLWYTLADCLAAKLRMGTAPRVLRALRFVPDGRQVLRRVKLRDQVEIDPNAEDFFRQVIVERRKVKNGRPHYGGLSESEREWLQQFLKILANATSYGIYVEMNRKKGTWARVRAHGLRTVEREVDGPEELGPFYSPPLATLITGGARLMLALAEHEVRRRGGRYSLLDTDSLAIVATEHGGLVPCPGGPERLPDGRDAVRALSWADVEAVRDRFQSLNPYGDGESILELEHENYAPCTCGEGHKSAKACTGKRRQLYAYVIASKRYTLVILEDGGEVALRRIGDDADAEAGQRAEGPNEDAWVRKHAEHGLGAYEAPTDPTTGKRVEKWEREVWRYLVARALGHPIELPAWAHQTALTQVRITTPEQLRWFDAYNRTAQGEAKPYAEAVKPFNFLGHAMPKPLTALPDGGHRDRFCLVAPAGERRRFVNRHDPRAGIYVAGIDFAPKTYADLVEEYDRHPERKFAGADGRPCQPETRGLLQDMPVFATGVKHVGKEGNDLEEHRAGLVTEPERQLDYDDSFLDDLARVLRDMGTADVARQTGYDRRTVRRLKAGECRPSAERLPGVMAAAARHARSHLGNADYPVPNDDASAVGFYSRTLSQQNSERNTYGHAINRLSERNGC